VTISLAIGAVLAAVAWAGLFLGDREHLWGRAAVAAGVIGVYGAAVDYRGIGHLFAHGTWWIEVLIGVASGAVLYAVFWVGEQLLVIVLPTLADEVADLYRVRRHTRFGFMPLVVSVAGSCEEIFFRGFFQHRAGVLIALGLYGIVHLPERKWILVIAAIVGGAWWGGMLTLTGGLVAPVVSHVTWGLAIIVVAPVGPSRWAKQTSAKLHRPSAPASDPTGAA
jgi:membrane protease YdiL (CAAX protease family)